VKKLLSPALLALAVSGLALTAPSAHAFPQELAKAELFKADLAAPIPAEEMSVVVMLPASCFGLEKEALCKAFREVAPRPPYPFKHAYAVADAAIPRLNSVAAQVGALPDAMKARRYVVLVDWMLTLERPRNVDYAYVNGEVAVYDQKERKLLWHALAFTWSGGDVASMGRAADFFLSDALHPIWRYGRMVQYAAANGVALRTLAAGAPTAAAGDYNLVVFNRHPDSSGMKSPSTAELTIVAPGQQPISAPLNFRMPADTYVALQLPAGKYRLNHSYKEGIDIEIGPGQPQAYEISRGMFASTQVKAVEPERIGKLAMVTRNIALPDPSARDRYAGPLAWADVQAGPQPAAGAAAAMAAPARRAGDNARIRFYGSNGGARIDFYQPAMCYRGSAKGTDVSLEDGTNWAAVRGKWQSIAIGMPDTPRTRAIKAPANPALREYYREFEVKANAPLTVGMSDRFTTYSGQTRTIGVCEAGVSFMPQPGGDYEVSFAMDNDRCRAIVKEIRVAADGGVTESAPELSRARICP
jgi:hypothetical protein